MRRRLGLVSIAGVLLGGIFLASIPLALAARDDHADGNDTAGRLDVRTVVFMAEPSPPTWTIHTFASWTAKDIRDSGFLAVVLDTRGDAAEDYIAVARSDGRDLVGRLFRRRPRGPDTIVGRIIVRKKGPEGATMSVGLAKLRFGPNRTSYSWWVVTQFTGPACPRTCLDQVPDDGPVRQELPPPSPEPSPSPTPTPSPTATASPTP
jgi:hypothetical protein